MRLIRFLSLCFFLFPVYLTGQTSSFFRYHFTDENGFLQNTSYNVGKNKLGYAWILSEYGLARLDGMHIKNYLNTTYFNSPNRKFSALLWDYQDELYACEDSANYNLFRLEIHPKKLSGTVNYFFNSIYHQVLFRSAIPAANQKTANNLLKDNNHFYYTRFHELYSFEADKINYLKEDQPLQHIPLASVSRIIPVEDHILILKENYTLCTIYKGIITEEKTDIAKATPFQEFVKSSLVLINNTGTFLLKDNSVYRLLMDNGRPVIELLIENLMIQDVSAIFWDEIQQTMLVSSSTDGLYVFKKQYFKSVISPLSHTYINNFYAQAELPDGSIFSANALVDTAGMISPQHKIKNIDRSALITDSKGNFFFSDNSALFKTDRAMTSVKKIIDLDGPVRSFIHQQDTIWLAGRKKIGYIWKDSFFEFHPGISPIGSDLPDITVLFKHKNQTWIGTENGLYILRQGKDQLQSVKELYNKRITYISACSDSSIFIGTKGHGSFISKRGRYKALPMDRNNALSTVNAAISDPNGFLWITTNRGLLKAGIAEIEKFADDKAETLYYYYYYKEEGFSTNEFNNAYTSPAIIKKNGLFSFSSLKGLVWFNPYDIKQGYFPAYVFIDELSFDDSIITSLSEIELPPSYTNFNVRVSVPYWGNRNNLELSYALSFAEKKWYPVDESGFIHFTKLPKGAYTLLIKARTGFGDKDVLINRVNFKVLPAWYETTWIRCVCVILLLCLVYGIFKIRLAAIEREKVRLDALVKEKTGELNSTIGKLSDTVSELTASQDELNKVVEQKEKLTSILAHDLRTPLKFMTMLSEYLNKNISSMPEEKINTLTAELMASSKGTFTFADELLTWLSLQKHNSKIVFYEENITKIIEDLCIYLSDIANAKNTRLIVHITDTVFAMTDERLLKVILRNLLDNAIKNTTDGQITISVIKTLKGLEIEIKDTGRGMTSEQLHEINQGNAYGFSFEIKEKLGFQIIKDFTYKLNGMIKVTSELGKGTVVTLLFPENS